MPPCCNNSVGDVAALSACHGATMRIIGENVTIALGLKAVFLVTTIARHHRPLDRHPGRYRRDRAGHGQRTEAAQVDR